MVDRGGRGLSSEEEAASVYLSYGKDLRSARKDADVGEHGQKLCGRERKAKNEGCSEDMETIRRQPYNLATGPD